jgi:toxin FitB
MLAAGLMRQGHVIDLDANMAVAAAVLGLDLKLPLADSVILATARAHGAVLWTQDADFEGLDGVRYFPKKA